jgi:hypothetical protein
MKTLTRNHVTCSLYGLPYVTTEFLCVLHAEVLLNIYRLSPAVPRVEASSNTSTVAQVVVGSDEEESLESETVKYGHESLGTRTRK